MKKIILLLTAFIVLQNIHAQFFQFGFQPHYFAFSGFRTDFDFRVNNKDTWVSLSPIFYAKEGNDYRYDEEGIKELIGYGGSLELLKYYTVNPEKNYKLYFSTGIQYIYYDLLYEANGWNTTVYDDLEALSYGWSEHSTIIQQKSLSLAFGVRWIIDQRMFLETYLGTRVKYAEYEFSDEYVQRRYNAYRFSIGYKGIVPHFGIKIGVGI